MSRPGAPARSLTLTEELEKLEQSITLTLQEIDHNFSKAHRIVTTSILPLVEQYGEHSRSVWDASKFWKQFFEASANVSLSGYEDQANDDEEATGMESTAMRDESSIEASQDLHGDDVDDHEDDVTRASAAERSATFHHGGGEEESMLEDAEISGSTPRPPATKTFRANFSSLDSPYENMKREMVDEEQHHTTVLDDEEGEEQEEDSTLFAQHTARLPDMSMTPRDLLKSRNRDESVPRHKDPLMHRVLDKTYRLQATPHKSALRISPTKGKQPERQEARPAWQDSPMSSPEIAIPKLRSEAFMSPFKSKAHLRLATATSSKGPRTPGVSVQTPAAGRKTRDVFAEEAEEGEEGNLRGKGKDKYEIDWDSDEDEDLGLYGGMSPPKTIQFALPPSKLLQTPAREASRRIVDDILLDAGADSSEYSPTVVKMNEDILNDTF